MGNNETRTVTRAQYLQFSGAIELARRQNRVLREIEATAAQAVSDAINDPNADADTILRKMKITVEN